jgi:hypothetical protein
LSRRNTVRSDGDVLGAILKAGTDIDYGFEDGKAAYLVPATGLIRVHGFTPGQRVGGIPAFSRTDYGTYGEEIFVPAQAVVPCPSDVSSVSPQRKGRPK